MTTWFTSDHHFGHDNIRKYCNRPFKNVEEMDEIMVDRWNEIIKVDDKVYHLGDFTLSGFDKFERYINQLNGKITIIPGGHDWRWLDGYYDRWLDMISSTTCRYFKLTHPLITLSFPEHGRDGYPLVIVLCHYSLRVWDRSHHNSLHLYGHSHGNLPPLPNSMDVGVDCHNFYPISLEQVLEKLR